MNHDRHSWHLHSPSQVATELGQPLATLTSKSSAACLPTGKDRCSCVHLGPRHKTGMFTCHLTTAGGPVPWPTSCQLTWRQRLQQWRCAQWWMKSDRMMAHAAVCILAIRCVHDLCCYPPAEAISEPHCRHGCSSCVKTWHRSEPSERHSCESVAHATMTQRNSKVSPTHHDWVAPLAGTLPAGLSGRMVLLGQSNPKAPRLVSAVQISL